MGDTWFFVGSSNNNWVCVVSVLAGFFGLIKKGYHLWKGNVDGNIV